MKRYRPLLTLPALAVCLVLSATSCATTKRPPPAWSDDMISAMAQGMHQNMMAAQRGNAGGAR